MLAFAAFAGFEGHHGRRECIVRRELFADKRIDFVEGYARFGTSGVWHEGIIVSHKFV